MKYSVIPDSNDGLYVIIVKTDIIVTWPSWGRLLPERDVPHTFQKLCARPFRRTKTDVAKFSSREDAALVVAALEILNSPETA